MIVLKFGGTSVSGSTQIQQVLKILKQQEKPIAVVVSALGGVTDTLHTLGKEAANGLTSYADGLKADRSLSGNATFRILAFTRMLFFM